MYGHRSNKTSFPIIFALLTFYMILMTSCGEKDVDISLLAEQDTFFQSSSINNKLDIMFVVDNSGSMQAEQDNLATNFNAFITDFSSQGYDYKLSVVGTDGWRTRFGTNCNVGTGGSPINVPCAKLRDGQGSAANHSGFFIIDPNTPDPIGAFGLNARLGINGTGDERAFDSIRQALDLNLDPNNTFLRNDSFLAVVIVSDEDDFSHDGAGMNNDYNSPAIHTVQSYVDYLDTKTTSTATNRRYNVSTITIMDDACLALNPTSGGHKGTRYMELADLTDGIKGSLCDASFADSLNLIQTRIAELSTQFVLSRRPNPATIVVHVNGSVILQDAVNGWTYNSTANSIVFHGSAIPSQGAAISVDFDPVEVL